MNHRERFHAIMNYEPFDRVPIYFFGTWPETRQRWAREGLDPTTGRGSAGPQLRGMDPDWEADDQGNIWDNQGLMNKNPIGPGQNQVVEETDRTCIIRSPLGGLTKHSKVGSSIPQHLEPDLQPTRDDWERFKTYLDPMAPQRWLPGWEERVAALQQRERVTCFSAGSLYGWLRDWMGVEAVSYLPYDDPDLYGQIIEDLADYYIALCSRFLDKVDFDFAYFHEDCCFNTGPLFSPALYETFYDQHYRRMIAAYRDMGVPWMLMDSDGKVDVLLPHWLESGFDIVFPIEVGTWQADPRAYRRQYGKDLRMFGGVDKHVIPKGEKAIRAALEPLKPLVAAGGFIPIPDHRIPPDCSLEQFGTYVRIFQETYSDVGTQAPMAVL